MGKFQSKMKLSGDIHEETLRLFQKQELKELMTVFNKLSLLNVGDKHAQGNPRKMREGHVGLNEDQFAQYFSYPGVLRKQIFKVFDRNGDGCIDKEEFLKGLAMCCRGPIDEKLRFVFSMCDLNEDSYVDKVELKDVLSSTAFSSFALLQAVALEEGKISDEHAIKNSNEFEEEINYMVNAAFESSDNNNDGLLSFDEFVKWLFNTPEILNIVYSVFEIRNHVEVAGVKQELERRRRSIRHLELKRKLESEDEEKKLGLHKIDNKTKRSLSASLSQEDSSTKKEHNSEAGIANSMEDGTEGRHIRLTSEDRVNISRTEDETMYKLIELMIDTEDAQSVLAKEKVINEGLKERINELERQNESLRVKLGKK